MRTIKRLVNGLIWALAFPIRLIIIKRKHKSHYRLGELVIVGEATMLAMRTNIIENYNLK